MAEIIVFGAGILCAILIYWAYKLGDRPQDQILRAVLLIAVLIFLMFIPKAVLDDQTVVFPVVNKSIDLNDSATQFYYGSYNIKDVNSTANTMYKVSMYFIIIVAALLMVFMYKLIIDYAKELVRLR